MHQTRSEQSRVTGVDPGSGSTVEFSEEEEGEGEGGVLEEASVRAHSTRQRGIVATLVGTDDAGLQALHNNVRRQVRVETGKEGRVNERSLV